MYSEMELASLLNQAKDDASVPVTTSNNNIHRESDNDEEKKLLLFRKDDPRDIRPHFVRLKQRFVSVRFCYLFNKI